MPTVYAVADPISQLDRIQRGLRAGDGRTSQPRRFSSHRIAAARLGHVVMQCQPQRGTSSRRTPRRSNTVRIDVPFLGLRSKGLQGTRRIHQRGLDRRLNSLLHRLLNQPIIDRRDRYPLLQIPLDRIVSVPRLVPVLPTPAVDQYDHRRRSIRRGLPKIHTLPRRLAAVDIVADRRLWSLGRLLGLLLRPGLLWHRIDRRDLQIVKLILVVKGPDPKPPDSKGRVGRLHQRPLHVVEVNLDQSALQATHQFDTMPSIVPWHRAFVLGQRTTRLTVDNHDLTAGRIGLGPKMHIVKMLGILIAKKHTAIPMIACVERAADPKRDRYIPSRYPLDQRDVVRTAHLGLIIADPLVEPKRRIPILVENRPRPLVGCLPTLLALREVVLEDHVSCHCPLGGLLPENRHRAELKTHPKP